ncbi:MAG: hypothetical protein KAS53_05060 [Candidatus Cloacimonetes bacterium]|nr:hypothetical protein [Candidatus Cloacimonadota bacterium]
MKTVNNDHHAWLLRCFIIHQYLNGNVDDDYDNIADWLELCSGIEKVDILTAKFDEAVYLCKTVSQFEDDRSKLLSKFVRNLVEFHFAWGSLESLIIKLLPEKKVNDYGKINALCGYLLKNNTSNYLPKYYITIFNKLISILRSDFYYQSDLENIGLLKQTTYSYKNYVDKAGIGIFTVYKVRNKFAHGAMNIPLTEEYTGNKVEELKLLNLSTKLVLLTIQMLLATDLKDSDYVLDDNYLLKKSNGKSALKYLLELHLEIDEYEE